MKINYKYVSVLILFLLIISFIFVIYYKANEYTNDNLVVEHIQISGTNTKVQEEIRLSLKDLFNVKLSTIDLYKVKARVLESSRIQSASVVRMYPNIIAIKVLEKKPYFIWQNNNDEFYIVNSENKVIRKARLEEYKQLILIKGGSLPIEASHEIRFYIYGNNYLLSKISTIEYTGYRWNLILHNKIIIKLPENNIQQAINHIVDMDKKYQILNRKIIYIDATVLGKLLIKPEE